MTHADTVTALAGMNLPQFVRDEIARLSAVRSNMADAPAAEWSLWLRDQEKIAAGLARSFRSLAKESARCAAMVQHTANGEG